MAEEFKIKDDETIEEEIERKKKSEPQIVYNWCCKECTTVIKLFNREDKPNCCTCGKKDFELLGWDYKEGLVDEALKEFKKENLFDLIKSESSKKHLGDDNLKMTMFLIMTSGLLKNPKNRMSMAIKSGSSEGKDNLIRTNLEHMPSDSHLFLTNATQSTIEDDIKDIRILAFSEINTNREGGANKDLIEVIKQKTEGGTHSSKKDLRDSMKSARLEKGEQGTIIFGTTETEMSVEMQTRFICGSIKTDPERIKLVNDNTCDNYSNLDRLVNNLKNEDNWVRIGLSAFFNKENQFEILLPYAKFLKDKINGKYLFDFKDPRSQRDIKRIFALTSAMTYLYQEQREVVDCEGQKVLVSIPSDFVKVLEISQEFFNQSYTGVDNRLSEVLKVMRSLEKNKGEWINRADIEKKMSVSLNTLKGYLSGLSSEGLVEGCPGEKMGERGIGGSFRTGRIYYKCRDIEKTPLIQESQLTALKEHLEKKMANSDR